MKQTFEYGSYQYEYFIEFSDRKSLTLVVRPDLRIIVRVPSGTTLDEIETFLIKKWHWLEKRLTEFRKYAKTHRQREYVSGESYHYLGRQYMILVEQAEQNQVKLERGKLRIYTTRGLRDSTHNQFLLNEWLESRREYIFKKIYVQAYKKFSYTRIPQLRQRVMTRRWGSCSSDGKIISLNPKLIEAPTEAIYYVCVHELCHVTNKKHDEAFYKELRKRIPEWREIKEKLEIRYG